MTSTKNVRFPLALAVIGLSLTACAASKKPAPDLAASPAAIPAAQAVPKRDSAGETLITPPAFDPPPSGERTKTDADNSPSTLPAVVAQDEADIDRVSKSINRITTMKAEFSQVDNRGLTQGRFYLARPGKLRFEYDEPSPVLIVADGRRVVVHDLKMDTIYRAKIKETPLRYLLMPNIDLRRDAKITNIRRDNGLLLVSAEETEGYGQGHITFIFSEPTLEIVRWIVTDPSGAQTIVSLRNAEFGGELDTALFDAPKESDEEDDF